MRNKMCVLGALVALAFAVMGCDDSGTKHHTDEEPPETSYTLAGLWEVKEMSISGELKPACASRMLISFADDWAKWGMSGTIGNGGNMVHFDIETDGGRQISFKNYENHCIDCETECDVKFKDIISSVFRFNITSGNKLIFFDSNDNPIVTFVNRTIEENPLPGTKWKLTEIISQDQSEKIDYSERNIIYEFQEDHKLIITGDGGDLFMFDSLKEGEYFYLYNRIVTCSSCLPVQNLAVYKSRSDVGKPNGIVDYWCIICTDADDCLTIPGGSIDETVWRSGENLYKMRMSGGGWSKQFIQFN